MLIKLATLLRNPLTRWTSHFTLFDVVAAQQQKFTLLCVLLSARSFQSFIDIICVLHLVATKLLALGDQASKLTQVQDTHCVFPLVLSFPLLQMQALAVLCKKDRLMRSPPASHDGWSMSPLSQILISLDLAQITPDRFIR